MCSCFGSCCFVKRCWQNWRTCIYISKTPCLPCPPHCSVCSCHQFASHGGMAPLSDVPCPPLVSTTVAEPPCVPRVPCSFLASMYAAEASATLDQLTAAVSHLTKSCLASVTAAAASIVASVDASVSCPGAACIAVDEATCALHVNLGIVQLAMVRVGV